MIENPKRPGILRANALFLMAGAGLILLNFIAPFIVQLLQRTDVNISQVGLLCLLDGLYYIPCILVPAGLYALRHDCAGLRLEPVSVKQTIQCLIAAYLCVMLANSLAAIWSVLLEVMGFTLYSTDIAMNTENELLIAIFAVAVLPGVCEELLFRGIVLGAYERGGTRKAIFVSSLMFATLHGSVQGLPVQMVIGIVLGFAVCSTGSVYVSMMIHTAYNAFLLLISYMFRNVDAGTYTGMYDALGGIVGIVTVVIEMVISVSLLVLILRSFARQGAQLGIEVCENRRISMSGTAIIVLIAGIVTVGYLYGQDIMLLLGYGI